MIKINPGLKERFESYLKKIVKGDEASCFTISNTTKKTETFYFTPIRTFENMQICGVVVNNTQEAKQFAALADGKFDYIAVDSEKKIEPERYVNPGDSGNLEGEILDLVKKSQVINFKANDVTVDAVDVFISNWVMGVPKRKIAIIGLGNIGFKLALKLIERGCWVNIYRRDQKKLQIQAETINITKPKGTLAKAWPCKNLAECLKNVHVVVATADTSNIISSEDLKNTVPNPLLIDCGKACFTDQVCLDMPVYRTDAGMALLYQLKMVVASRQHLYPKFGRKMVDGKRYVCGLSGVKGDIVLHDLKDISSFIGICDGKGGLLPQ